MSVFDIKDAELPFNDDMFQRMSKIAQRELDNTECQQYTQAIVLYTDSEKEYFSVIKNAVSDEESGEQSLIDLLRSDCNTCIHTVLCMWHEGCIDLPSYKFRKMLLELNEENANAGIFVKTTVGYSLIELKRTMSKI